MINMAVLFNFQMLKMAPIQFIASHHQEWRLSGGLDACAGRVEVYYHGIWNTVCDGSWYRNEADVLCRSLGCSEKASVSRVAFNHTLLGKMSYQCLGSEDSLAGCDWLYNKVSPCEQFRAAGVICNGSLGLGGSANTPGPEAVTLTSHLSSPSWSSPENWEPTPSYQMLQILCILLGILLFLVTLTLIITLKWRRKNGTLDCAVSSGLASAPALVNHSVQITATEARHDYRDIPTSLPKEEVRPVPVSDDSDSDYEHYDFNHKPPVALSTFYSEHLPPPPPGAAGGKYVTALFGIVWVEVP
ncbi:T-cell differentiation antigen CD6 [Varanus komodoensis]|nr:T-cell differentiation antigen CD6 [Varanus komodoensis]